MPNFKSFETHEEYLQWYRDYRKKNIEKYRKYYREYNKEWRKKHGYHNEYKWKKENPEKHRANKLLEYAVRHKMIVKKPCAVCGKIKNVGGHHSDYSKPLEVIWLCPIHHKQLHQEAKKKIEAQRSEIRKNNSKI